MNILEKADPHAVRYIKQFMGIKGHGVGLLDAFHHSPSGIHDQCPSAPGGIHMEVSADLS